MANKIKLGRATKARLNSIVGSLEANEIVYATDTFEIGIKTGSSLVWFPSAQELAKKVDKVSGKGLSTNDYTTTEKNKLSGIQTGAQKNPTFKTVGGQSIVGTGDIPVSGGSEYVLTKSKIDTALKGTGYNSIALGISASASQSNSTAVGPDATASGANSAALGQNSTASGASSVALGRSTTASGGSSVALGDYATVTGTDSTAIGYNAQAGSSDRLIRLGATNLSTLQSSKSLSVTSDIRDKTDIEEVPKALDFIKDLNPITYVSNDREHYISEEQKETDTYKNYLMVEDYDRKSHSQGTKKGKRRRVGLSAQEVRAKLIEHYGSDNYADVVNDNFVEFEERELDVPKGLENKLTMSYETMVPFLIKAIQEQQEQIEELKKKINKE